MRITIDITEGDVTAVTAVGSPVDVTAPAPGGQWVGTQDINAGPAPDIQTASPGAQPSSAAPAAASGADSGTTGISAGPAPAGLTGDPASPETSS
jgi:hypothetical protein